MSHELQDPLARRIPCGTATGHVTTSTERAAWIWSAGDDACIAAGMRHGAEAFVGRRRLGAGIRVLDLACGSGNATIPASRTGAVVTGLDLVASSLDQASGWAAREGLEIAFDQGSVEALPYPDAAFDVVLSLFGVMFAARPDRVLAELARVTRPGGRVALASWTPGGFMGELMAIQAALTPPRLDQPDPLRWGDPDLVGEWFDDGQWEAATEVRTLRVRYPWTPGGTAELFRAAYAPTVRAFESLDPDGRAALAARLDRHWSRHRRATARGTVVEAEFLEVAAVRR